VRDAGADISRALTPEVWDGEAWSATQCRTALRAIVNSPHAAVRVSQLAKELGAGGVAALESMNEQNLILRRSFEDDARDVDPAAFGPPPPDMAPTGTSLGARSR
jgi:hypothetical protein